MTLARKKHKILTDFLKSKGTTLSEIRALKVGKNEELEKIVAEFTYSMSVIFVTEDLLAFFDFSRDKLERIKKEHGKCKNSHIKKFANR